MTVGHNRPCQAQLRARLYYTIRSYTKSDYTLTSQRTTHGSDTRHQVHMGAYSPRPLITSHRLTPSPLINLGWKLQSYIYIVWDHTPIQPDHTPEDTCPSKNSLASPDIQDFACISTYTDNGYIKPCPDVVYVCTCGSVYYQAG